MQLTHVLRGDPRASVPASENDGLLNGAAMSVAGKARQPTAEMNVVPRCLDVDNAPQCVGHRVMKRTCWWLGCTTR
jgi:hypothetical protein